MMIEDRRRFGRMMKFLRELKKRRKIEDEVIKKYH